MARLPRADDVLASRAFRRLTHFATSNASHRLLGRCRLAILAIESAAGESAHYAGRLPEARSNEGMMRFQLMSRIRSPAENFLRVTAAFLIGHDAGRRADLNAQHAGDVCLPRVLPLTLRANGPGLHHRRAITQLAADAFPYGPSAYLPIASLLRRYFSRLMHYCAVTSPFLMIYAMSSSRHLRADASRARLKAALYVRSGMLLTRSRRSPFTHDQGRDNFMSHRLMAFDYCRGRRAHGRLPPRVLPPGCR